MSVQAKNIYSKATLLGSKEKGHFCSKQLLICLRLKEYENGDVLKDVTKSAQYYY